jgi:5-methylcytosine-specific restriction protein A
MAKEWAKAFYNSGAWIECREAYIISVHGLCEKCLAKDIIQPGWIVHHTIRLTPQNTNNPEISLNHKHLRYDCQTCHNQEYNQKNTAEGLCFDSEGQLIRSE